MQNRCAIKLHSIAGLGAKRKLLEIFVTTSAMSCHVLRYANLELLAKEAAKRLQASFVISSRDPVGWVSAPCRSVGRTGMQPGIESVISGQLLHCVFPGICFALKWILYESVANTKRLIKRIIDLSFDVCMFMI